MKRKRFDRRAWPRVRSGEQSVVHLPGGVIVDYRAGEVLKPKRVTLAGRTLCLLDSGYRWVHYVPLAAPHALTVQLDDVGRVQQFYLDVGQTTGLDGEGLPWIDDLYLDIAGTLEVSPDGHWTVGHAEVLDEAELDAALAQGRVTPEQHALAWAETRRLLGALRAFPFGPLEVVRRYLQDPYT
ncbi:hypothetical protein DKM44_07070 [Deinococcus irradiatisoli]|uniref:DUF402 domain-containing protein n=1 Tax=Deinococcus irradiatisoli TaxID=2202254 RepID=A0A2Z3JMX5_9DEIO|nr:DUF402 domain-containing protein [Deinococcus irradiatisoli]AWN23018.1 hypothetical protein DKM44_07070 [Deinococcus irradiatisoli]